MTTLLLFAGLLLAAALLSGLAERTILSTSTFFVIAGFLAGEGMLGWLELRQEDEVVERLADLALFVVLYVDGMRLGLAELRSAWRLPGRALLLGLPLTAGVIAGLAWWLLDLNWIEAWLVAVVLSPTDPVFASAIVGRAGIARPLRHLLNVESGLNDGLALPLVLALLAIGASEPAHPLQLVTQVVAGVALGVAVPFASEALRRRLHSELSPLYAPLYAVAIGLLVYAVASETHANEYLAAFMAGVTLRTRCADLAESFHPLGEQTAELAKLAALLAFGALITPSLLAEFGPGAWIFAALVLVVARPVAVGAALIGSSLAWPERLAAGWFGPKGFASVIYAVLVLHSDLPDRERLFHLIALVVVVSIVAHSSTDVPMARWLRRRGAGEGRERSGNDAGATP